MEKRWLWDINTNIIGNGRHWERGHGNNPPPPINTTPDKVHPLYRENLSHNMLMNLFRENTNTNPKNDLDPRQLTFNDYYNGTISSVLSTFANRLDSFPRKDLDLKEEEHPKPLRVSDCRRILRDTAKLPGASTLTIKDLYLYRPENEAKERSQLDAISMSLRNFRDRMTWICVPFLAFWEQDSTPARPRPTSCDLTLHLCGGTYNGNEMMPLGNLDYFGMIFYKATSVADADRHYWARTFAMDKGFLDWEGVADRVRRSRDEQADRIFAGHAPRVRPTARRGGGNGYCCRQVSTNPYVKQCISQDPADYCVDTGSQYCSSHNC